MKSGFRPDIEGLRGIAVFVVVAFHCGLRGFSGGFVGVDVFFVLSGYLITGLLVTGVRSESGLKLREFYARRARRLLPAATLMAIVTLAAAAVILGPGELRAAARAARATSVYLSNVFFAVNSANYFAPDVRQNPMLHTWSLAVEEQFYLFWPLLIMFALKILRSTRVLVVLLCVVSLASLLAAGLLTDANPEYSFFGLHTRAWEFGIGGLAVLMPAGAVRLGAAGWAWVSWIGIAILLGSVATISEGMHFPGWVACFPVLGTTLALIAGAEHPHHGAARVLDTRPFQTVGGLSYSWYLWHWPFLVFATALYPDISVLSKVLVAAASLGVAAVTHHVFENPLRFHPALVRRPFASLGFGAILMGASLVAATLCVFVARRLDRDPAMVRITASVDDVARMPRERCVSVGNSAEVKTCVFGDDASPTIVAVFGDSHAIQWFNALRHGAETNHWRLVTFLKSGCPATDVALGPGGTWRKECAEWRTDAVRRIQALRPSIVVVSSATTYVRRSRDPAGVSRVSVLAWRDGTRRTLAALSANGLRVVQLRDTPLPGFDVPSCLARAVRHAWYPAGSCDPDAAASMDATIYAAEVDGARGLANVHLVDMNDEVCRAGTCPAEQNGMIVFRDDNHLSGTFAESLWPALERALTRDLHRAGSGT